MNYDSQELTVSKKEVYAFFLIFIVAFAIWFVYSTDSANKLGFQKGFVCAFEHYSDSNSTIDLDDYSPSNYCEAFYTLFDKLVVDKSVMVNGLGQVIKDMDWGDSDE